MGLSMVSSVKNTAFKKMMVAAYHGHQAANRVKSSSSIPHDLKNALKDIRVNGHTATKYLHANDDHKVTKKEAVTVMKALKKKGFGHHMNTADATSFVHREFAHVGASEDAIKRQHLADRAKEMAAEHLAELNKNKTSVEAKATTSHAVSKIEHSSVNHVQVGHVTSSPITGAAWHAHEAPAKLATDQTPEQHSGGSIQTAKHEEETIDLAID